MAVQLEATPQSNSTIITERITTEDELKTFLDKHDVPWRTWKLGIDQSPAELLRWLTELKVKFVYDFAKGLSLHASTVCVTFEQENDRNITLHEGRYGPDGQIHTRPLIERVLYTDEHPADARKRVLKFIFGITEDALLYENGGFRHGVSVWREWQGLYIWCHKTRYTYVLPPTLTQNPRYFPPNERIYPGIPNIFHWQKVE